MQQRHSFNLLVHCDLSSPALEFDKSNGILQVPLASLQAYCTAFHAARVLLICICFVRPQEPGM